LADHFKIKSVLETEITTLGIIVDLKYMLGLNNHWPTCEISQMNALHGKCNKPKRNFYKPLLIDNSMQTHKNNSAICVSNKKIYGHTFFMIFSRKTTKK